LSADAAIRKLGLGTVQFGLAYGVTNERGRVPEPEVGRIVETAIAAGIDLFDTAAAYGDSESVLGRALGPQSGVRIVSKLPAIAADSIGAAELDQCRAAVDGSLVRLGRRSLDTLLLHRPDDLRKRGADRLVALLAELKRRGVVAKIGVSAYDYAQIALAQTTLPLDAVQVPVNLLDQRFLQDGTLDRLKQERVEIHARSAFLQGALLPDPARLPRHFLRYRDRLRAVAAAAEGTGVSRLSLCLRFVMAQPAVDRVIVGVTSVAELQEIFGAARDPVPLPDGLATLACDDPDLLNPSLWPAEERGDK
jgi:aryl-alcohol dehydrogenase-like predicted oxidoreductase